MTFSVDGRAISGTLGCNTYSGLATVEEGSITTDDESLSHTERTCEKPDGAIEQEERYLGLLPQVSRYGVYGDQLFMQAGDVFALFKAR